MIISEVVTLGIYAFSMIFLPEYFGAFVFCSYIFPLNSRRPRFRSIVRLLGAVWMESRGHRCDKRATSVDHQDD